MERIQLQPFVDFTSYANQNSGETMRGMQAPKPQENSVPSKGDREAKPDRRKFLSLAAGLAALTTMAPTAFARNFGSDAEPQRYGWRRGDACYSVGRLGR